MQKLIKLIKNDDNFILDDDLNVFTYILNIKNNNFGSNISGYVCNLKLKEPFYKDLLNYFKNKH